VEKLALLHQGLPSMASGGPRSRSTFDQNAIPYTCAWASLRSCI